MFAPIENLDQDAAGIIEDFTLQRDSWKAAAENGDLDTLERLHRRGWIEQRALTFAATLPAAKWLIEHGYTDFGSTAAHSAAVKDRPDVLDYLLSRGFGCGQYANLRVYKKSDHARVKEILQKHGYTKTPDDIIDASTAREIINNYCESWRSWDPDYDERNGIEDLSTGVGLGELDLTLASCINTAAGVYVTSPDQFTAEDARILVRRRDEMYRDLIDKYVEFTMGVNLSRVEKRQIKDWLAARFI